MRRRRRPDDSGVPERLARFAAAEWPFVTPLVLNALSEPEATNRPRMTFKAMNRSAPLYLTTATL